MHVMYVSSTIIMIMLTGFWLREKNLLNSFGVFELSGISGKGYFLLFGFSTYEISPFVLVFRRTLSKVTPSTIFKYIKPCQDNQK